MEVTIVDSRRELAEVTRVLDGRCALVVGDITDKEWSDESKYPRKQWLILEEPESGEKFTVVDNRDGECLREDFSSLDGAILYLCDCYTSCEYQDAWDYPGAVLDRGSLYDKDGDKPKTWVIRCPMWLNEHGGFVFGYVKSLVPHGRSEDILDRDVMNAIHFRSRDLAVAAGISMEITGFSADGNIVPLDEERARSGNVDV